MVNFIEEMSKVERKQKRDLLLSCLRSAGGHTFAVPESRVVFAVEPVINTPNCNMFKVAIAYCNKSDKFKKSVGELIALYRLQQLGNYTIIKNVHGIADVAISLRVNMGS